MANNIFNYIKNSGGSPLSLTAEQLITLVGKTPEFGNEILIYPRGLGNEEYSTRVDIPFVIFAPYLRQAGLTGAKNLQYVVDSYPPPSFAIALPLPTSGLSTTYGVTYEATPMGAGAALFLNQFKGGATDYVINRFQPSNLAAGAATGVTSYISGLVAGLKNKDAALLGTVGAVAGTAAGAGTTSYAALNEALSVGGDGVKQAALTGLGVAENPFTEQIFKNVQPRSFSYKFKFYPKSRDEAELIDKIIQIFKFYMLPAHARGTFSIDADIGVFFAYPYEFYITYSVQNTTFTLLPSVLRSMEVKYNEGLDSPKFYVADNTGKQYPYQTSLTLDFIEAMILTRDKIEENMKVIERDYKVRSEDVSTGNIPTKADRFRF